MSYFKTYIFVFQILLLTSCAAFPPPFNSSKKLNPDSVEIIKKEQVIGSYSWSLRDHSSEIILKENDSFTKNIQNSFYKGYQKGNFRIVDNVIKLKSDSIIYQEWKDLINNKTIIHRELDTTKSEFIITELGLHEKQSDGTYSKTPSHIKNKY